MTKKREVAKSLSNHLLLMKTCAVYPFEDWSNFSYILYAYFVWLTFNLPIPVLAMLKFFTVEINFDLISKMVWIIAETGIAALKYLPLKNRPRDVKRTIEYRLNMKIFNEYDEYQNEVIVKPTCHVIKVLFWFYTAMCLTSFLSWVSGGFLSGRRELPLDIYLPFDLDAADNWVFAGVYALVFCGAGNATISNISVDIVTSSLMYHATAQIKILKDNLQNLIQKAEGDLHNSSDAILTKENRLKLKNHLIYLKICRCVEHHQAIREFVRDIEDTFSFVFFSQFCASIVIICTCCLRITLVKPFSGEFLSMATFLSYTLFQVGLYCYFGHLLLEESQTINDAIYAGDWVELEPKSKKALMILMENSKQPLSVVAGRMLTLSLDTFVMIIKRSYSLLAVLNTFK